MGNIKLKNIIAPITEAYQKNGHKYDAMTGMAVAMDKAFVGKDGILGVNNVFISWNEIKRLQKKYRK